MARKRTKKKSTTKKRTAKFTAPRVGITAYNIQLAVGALLIGFAGVLTVGDALTKALISGIIMAAGFYLLHMQYVKNRALLALGALLVSLPGFLMSTWWLFGILVAAGFFILHHDK